LAMTSGDPCRGLAANSYPVSARKLVITVRPYGEQLI
jgi:hypothetical protein